MFVCVNFSFKLTFRCLHEYIQNIYPHIKVAGCLSVCVYRRISLSAERLWSCSFSQALERFISTFGQSTTTLQREITPGKNNKFRAVLSLTYAILSYTPIPFICFALCIFTFKILATSGYFHPCFAHFYGVYISRFLFINCSTICVLK